MPELGEGVLAALNHHPEHSEDTCAFCTASKEPTEENNVLTDSFDEDANELPGLNLEGMAFRNCAGKLGAALVSAGLSQLEGRVRLEGLEGALPVQSAAHHLIPGNAALKKSELMPHLHCDFVLNELDLLAKKLEKTQSLWCPEAQQNPDEDPKKRQMKMLVLRLHTISRRLKRFVTHPGPAWRENLVTSRFSLAYIRERVLKTGSI